jgi:hypothetical protein
MAYYFLHSSEQQWQGVLDTTLYVINFVSDLRHVSGFLWVLPVSSTKKTDLRLVSQLFSPGVHSFLHQSKFDSYDITEILLKVALKHHNPNP